MSKQEEFNNAVYNNDFNKVKMLLKLKTIDPTDEYNNPLMHCATYGYTNVFQLLIKDSRSHYAGLGTNALELASHNGHIDIVNIILNIKKINPSTFRNRPIIKSYVAGHKDILKLLWAEKIIKDTLKNNNLKLYNKLIKQDVENKINDF